MNFEREEYNEFGVKTPQNTKKNNTPNLTLIVLVTVLFSVFNFIVGYMIGKFLNFPKTQEIAANSKNDYNPTKDLLGIETAKAEKENLKKVDENVYLDLESTDSNSLDILPNLPPEQNNKSQQEKISTAKQNIESSAKIVQSKETNKTNKKTVTSYKEST
ncbi:MAG: hypothetical protein ACP5KI_05725, partial [Brevinematia bacterium]